MARANRHFISVYAWHLTHRCHKREFFLKFAQDNQRWMHWLFEAKKHLGLCILNFTVTSNHVLLLVYDTGDGNVTIPRSIQLIAGKTGQEFNARKKRKGAYWQDRYHATAVATDDHLLQCLVYTESIAVGDKDYVEKVKDQMGYKAIGRKIMENRDSYVLRETRFPYQNISDRLMGLPPQDNMFYWQIEPDGNLGRAKL